MAGLSGKAAWLGVAKQTAKGTVATTLKFKNAFSGGNIGPVRETDRLAETDSSRDQGAAYVTTGGVEGSPEVYVRPGSIGMYLLGVMGAVTTTGTAPSFVHTFKPVDTLPYMTLWRNVGGTAGVYESYADCIIGSATFSAEAGGPMTAALGVQGIKPDRLTVDPSTGVQMDNATVFNYNNAAVQLGGGATSLIRSMEVTIENNLSRQQTDDFLPYDVVVGTREISLGFDMVFENLDEYNKFHYGGAAGIAISPNIFTSSAKFTYTIDTNTEIVFDLPSIAYEEFPIEPNPGGDPIVVSVRAVAQKAVGVTDLLSVTLKNNVTSY